MESVCGTRLSRHLFYSFYEQDTSDRRPEQRDETWGVGLAWESDLAGWWIGSTEWAQGAQSSRQPDSSSWYFRSAGLEVIAGAQPATQQDQEATWLCRDSATSETVSKQQWTADVRLNFTYN